MVRSAATLRVSNHEARMLAFGLAAAGGFGLVDRAEPARALADLHLDLGVPAARRLVIDAFAGPVDIALDGAVGRGRDRARRRRQQDRVGVLRRFGGAEYRRLLVADPPVPGCDEGALPHAGLGVARGLLIGIVVVGKPHIGQRPSVLHHPFLDVLAIDLASGDRTAATVGLLHMTGPALVLDVVGEFVARGNATGPALALGIETKLVPRRRIDAAKTDFGIADLNLVAVMDLRN